MPSPTRPSSSCGVESAGEVWCVSERCVGDRDEADSQRLIVIASLGPVVVRLAGMAIERERERHSQSRQN